MKLTGKLRDLGDSVLFGPQLDDIDAALDHFLRRLRSIGRFDVAEIDNPVKPTALKSLVH